jgi:hypothetical protein
MFRKFKTLILFLVLATMSLRGMAAVDMWHCAHHQRDAIFAVTDRHAAHHPGQHDSVSGPVDHAADHSNQDSSAPAGPSDESASNMAVHCITSVVAPVQRAAFSPAPVGASRIPFIAQRMAVVVPPQPERPPLVRPL